MANLCAIRKILLEDNGNSSIITTTVWMELHDQHQLHDALETR